MSLAATDSSLQNDLRKLVPHFGTLTLVQFPVALLPVIHRVLPTEGPSSLAEVALTLGLVFPVFIFFSTLAITATLQAVRSALSRGRMAPLDFLVQALTGARSWFLPSLVAMGVTLLGLPTVVLAVYFLASYLFVPHEAISTPGQKVTAYLSRSSRLARAAGWKRFAAAAFLLGLDIVVFVASEAAGTRSAEMISSPEGREAVALATKSLISLITALPVNVGIALWYLRLRDNHERSR